MATYNGSNYLKEQLDSILRQSYQDIEIIICDDCSSDNTWEIVQKYAREDSRIQPYRNDSNLGFKKNFEKAISLCSGQYIALSDQDDIWEQTHLETLLNIIDSNDIACGDAALIDSNSKELGKTLSEADFFFLCPPQKQDLAYRIFFNNSCFQGASMLIRSDFLKLAIPFPKDVLYHDTWFSALSCFNNGLVYTKEIVTKHRIHENNVSGRPHWKCLFNAIHYKKNRERKDRVPLANAIKERLNNLTPQQRTLLDYINVYRNNRNSLVGKVKNLFFRMAHYRAIYTTKFKVFFEW